MTRIKKAYAARCEATDCGWVGRAQDTQVLAEQDGDWHTTTMARLKDEPPHPTTVTVGYRGFKKTE